MTRSTVLGYLDKVARTKYHVRHNFFQDKINLTIPVQDADAAYVYDLPVHEILREIERHVGAIEKHEQQSPDRNDGDLREAAKFFEPFVLHHWQLVRLLNELRCTMPILQLRADIRKIAKKIAKLELKLRNTSAPSLLEEIHDELAKLRPEALLLKAEYEAELGRILQDENTKIALQEALVVATLLNVVFRKGMSVPMMSDDLSLVEQQREYRELLRDWHIVFDRERRPSFEGDTAPVQRTEVFPAIFKHHPSLLAKEAIPNDPLASAKYIISWVLWAQEFHRDGNPWRLGGTRLRREFIFVNSHWQNKTFASFIDTADPYARRFLAYVNWMFFIPRLTLNFSLLYHHLFNERELNPLEREFSYWIRFRAHWTRFWFEVINDIYWILNGLIICFVLNGGVLSGPGLYLSMTVQTLDLVCSILRASVELYRLYQMHADLKEIDPNLNIEKAMNERFWFEVCALGYSVFHFSILVLCLYLTLPTMAAVSTMWPVVGGFCAVIMTGATYFLQDYFNKTRNNLYQPKPEELSESMARGFSHTGM